MTHVVLVPGAGGAASYWYRLAPLLTAAGFEVTAVDLPAGDESAGWSAYADAIEAYADRCADPDLVLVAQSMAGFSAPLVCARRPVRQLVLLNAMIPVPRETGGAWWEVTGQGEASAAYAREQGRRPEFEVDEVFFHDVPAEVVAHLTAHGEPEQSDRPFAEPWPLAAWPDVPTAVLVGRDDRLFPLEFQRRIAQERLGLPIHEVPGGHLAALSHPEMVFRRLVELIGPPR